MHSTQGYGVQHHKAQQGLVTAKIGGWYALDNSGKEKAQKIRKNLDKFPLPYKVFDRKICNQSIKQDLQMENVFVVDLTALRGSDQCGK